MDAAERWALAAAALPTLTGTDYRVYVALVARADQADWSGTFGQIGDTLGLSWPTVARAFAEFQTARLVERIGETHRGSVWRLIYHGRSSAPDTSLTVETCIKPPKPRVSKDTEYNTTTTPERPPMHPNERPPTGGGGESSVRDDVSSVNRGYVKLSPSQPATAQTAAAAARSAEMLADAPKEAKAERLRDAGVKDARTVRDLAAKHTDREIRKAVELANSSKTARDRAALTVTILRRGTAAQALTADIEKADKAQRSQTQRAAAAASTLSAAAQIRATVEEESRIIRAAPPQLIREALAVAIVQGAAHPRAKYAPRLVARDPGAALTDALHAFHRPRVAEWIRHAQPGKVRALPVEAESLLQ